VGPHRPRDTVKLRRVPKAFCHRGPPKGWVQHQGNDLGYGKSTEDVTMDDPQPSAKGPGLRVQFND
jgi:hypothetical protein